MAAVGSRLLDFPNHNLPLPELRAAFQMFDKDLSGTIDLQELRCLVSLFGSLNHIWQYLAIVSRCFTMIASLLGVAKSESWGSLHSAPGAECGAASGETQCSNPADWPTFQMSAQQKRDGPMSYVGFRLGKESGTPQAMFTRPFNANTVGHSTKL